MPPVFDNTTIIRFSQEGENDFAVDSPCINMRISLDIVSGTALYTIPDDVLSIRRVTWKGTKLDPLPHRSEREVFQRANQIGKPFWYIFNNIGQNKLKFFPCPGESVSSTTSNLYGSEIGNRIIIEYWRAPDFSTYVLPAYFRRRLLKAFVLKSCFAIEGRGQNVKNTQYFENKYQMLKGQYKQLLQDIHNKPRKLTLNNIPGGNYFPGQPVLPIATFGTAVRDGE